jgi:hypothetical protein
MIFMLRDIYNPHITETNNLMENQTALNCQKGSPVEKK